MMDSHQYSTAMKGDTGLTDGLCEDEASSCSLIGGSGRREGFVVMLGHMQKDKIEARGWMAGLFV